MPLVSVLRNKYVSGWNSPADDTSCERTQVKDLTEALRDRYLTDAMMTMYAPADGSRGHRVNQCGIELYPKPLVVGVFMVDYDTLHHLSWPSDDRAIGHIFRWKKIPMLRTAGFFVTLHGARIVQPLAQPIPLIDADPYFNDWLDRLQHEGVEFDKNCRSAGRLWRLPNVVRYDDTLDKEIHYTPPWIDLDWMRPIELEPLPAAVLEDHTAARAAPERRKVLPVKREQASDPGELWSLRAPVIAHAVKSVSSEWHSLFMQLAGALIDKGAPPSRLVAICEAISHETELDTRVEDRRASAESTLQRFYQGLSYTGYRSLARDHRSVALALEESLKIQCQEDLDRWRMDIEAPPLPSADEVAAQLAEIIELSLIHI